MGKLNFSRDNSDDKLKNLGIGKIGAIKSWLEDMDIKKYTINDDLTIDVNQNVVLDSKLIDHLPDYIQFGIVESAFIIRRCKLTTLKGCPRQCTSFFCNYNNLKSLEYSPENVSLTFDCSWNLLKTLDYLHIPPNTGTTIYVLGGNDIDPAIIGRYRVRGYKISYL